MGALTMSRYLELIHDADWSELSRLIGGGRVSVRRVARDMNCTVDDVIDRCREHNVVVDL